MTTFDDLHKIILQGENAQIEFKSDISDSVLRGLSTDIAALSNTQGGMIVFGVTDSKDPKGCDLTGDERERISQEASKCLPIVAIDVEEVPFGARKFMVVKIPKSTVVHNDYQKKFPVRVGTITDYLDALGLVMLLQERGIVSQGTLEQSQISSPTERTPLPENEVSMIVKPLRSSNKTIRLQALQDMTGLPYRYILLESEPMADAIGSILAGEDDEEVGFILDVLRGIANVGTDKEKKTLKAWKPRLSDIAVSFRSPETATRAIQVLQFLKSKAALDSLIRWIVEADDNVYSRVQPNNILANVAYYGTRNETRAAMYDLLEKAKDERTMGRTLDALKTLRTFGWG